MASRLVTSATKMTLRDVVPGAQAQTTLTLASGAATPVYAHHVIAAQSGTSDDFDTVTLTNLRAGDVVEWTVDTGDTITFTSGVGNITTDTGESIVAVGGETVRTKVNAAGDGVIATHLKTSTRQIETLSALGALQSTQFTGGEIVNLKERTAGTGRGAGNFLATTDDISAFVTLDTDQAVYVPFADDATGASGGFVRIYESLRFEDCGAYGDDVTDVGAAINRLIALAGAINTLGGTAKVEVTATRGSYLTSVPIRHDQGRVVVRGQGPGTLIKYSGATGHGVHLGGTHTGGNGGGTVSATKANYGGFHGFEIRATNTGHASGAGLNCEDMDRWDVSNLLIQGFATSLRLWNCDNSNFSEIRGAYGSRSSVMDYFIHIEGDADSDTIGFNTSNRFFRLDFIPASGSAAVMSSGLRAEQFDGLWMNGCHFIYADYGIDITSAGGTSGNNHSVSAFFTDCYADTTGIAGVRIGGEDTKNINFNGSDFRDAGGVTSIASSTAADHRGVIITPDAGGVVDGVQFTGGRIWQSDREGIYAVDGSGTLDNLSVVGVQFEDNNVDDAADIADIYIDASSANVSATSHAGNVAGGRVLHIGPNAGDVTFNFSGSHSTASTKYFDERSTKLGDLILGSSIRIAGQTMQRTEDDSLFSIRGGNATNGGAEILLYGKNHASLAGDHYARFGYNDADGAYRIQHVNAAGTPTNIITADHESLDIHRDAEFLNDALFSAFFGFGAVTTPTISSGSLTVTNSVIRPSGEGATADDLDVIVTTDIAEGTIILLNGGAGHNITIRDASVNSGNVRPRTSGSVILDSLRKWIALRLNSDNVWYELWRSEA